jgi:TonB family protein
MRLALMLCLAAIAICQIPDDVLQIGPGVDPPKLLAKTQPRYTDEARKAGAQGFVILEVVVDDKGRATNIKVLSPLGFGLDESAIKAVEKWKFAPGRKDGKPVKVLATIDVRFNLKGGGPFPDSLRTSAPSSILRCKI